MAYNTASFNSERENYFKNSASNQYYSDSVSVNACIAFEKIRCFYIWFLYFTYLHCYYLDNIQNFLKFHNHLWHVFDFALLALNLYRLSLHIFPSTSYHTVRWILTQIYLTVELR